MNTFADRVIAFNKSLCFEHPLPEGIRIMNPFQENPWALAASSEFYRKYYSDNRPRRFIIGINPGRFGAGLTGVPFTDPKRLKEKCGITSYDGPPAHEPSSQFIYEMIDAYGGPEKFYAEFYINSICPLGFTSPGKNGREVNYNYYDSPALATCALPFMLESLRAQLAFNLLTDMCFCLGAGKNEKFLKGLNAEHSFCDKLVPLEHPRYIIQYKAKQKDKYIEKYLAAFAAAG